MTLDYLLNILFKKKKKSVEKLQNMGETAAHIYFKHLKTGGRN